MKFPVNIVTVIFCVLNLKPFNCYTHWIVTEDGRIDVETNSPFYMRKPHDLVALLKQEERVGKLDQLKRDLNKKKEYIDRNEEMGFEAQFFREDPDCGAAGKPLVEHDLYISTVLPLENKGISPEDHINLREPPSSRITPPVCQDITPLDYSFHAYEHLHAMQIRTNLSGAGELGLKNAITHHESVDDFGWLVREALKQNTTSWVLYNMAAFYWRIKGEPYNAVECLRRALHYSPRDGKDVALISLGNLLHRSRYSEDAATVVESAVEISADLNVNHFTLGNIYAILMRYNQSIQCFENTLQIQPDFEAAAIRRSAVLCHWKFEKALAAKQQELRNTLEELQGYQSRQLRLHSETESVVTEQASLKAREISEEALRAAVKAREEHGYYGEYCYKPIASSDELVCTVPPPGSSRRNYHSLYNEETEDLDEQPLQHAYHHHHHAGQTASAQNAGNHTPPPPPPLARTPQRAARRESEERLSSSSSVADSRTRREDDSDNNEEDDGTQKPAPRSSGSGRQSG